MNSLKVSKKIIVPFLLALFVFGMIAVIPTNAAITGLRLQEQISLTGFSLTAVDSSASSTDYMLVDHYFYTPMGETIWSKDGETSAGTGTSYISLEDSCIIGEYASEPMSWSDFAYIKSSFSATEAEGGDTACGSGNITDVSLSAGSTSSYISGSADFADAFNDGGTAAETVTWTSDCWSDQDSDGTDDSASVPEEDYVHFTKNVYIYYCLKVDGSATDVACSFAIQLGFYVDASTTYDVKIEVNGGSDAASSYTSDWTYTGATSAELDYFECEGHAIAGILDLSELIADDSDSSPVIAGLDWWKVIITAEILRCVLELAKLIIMELELPQLLQAMFII